MKSICIIFIVALLPQLVFAQASRLQRVGGGDPWAPSAQRVKTEKETFRVSRVGSSTASETRETLLELFDLVKTTYRVSDDGSIISRPPPGIENLRQLSGRVSQALSGGSYIINRTRDPDVVYTPSADPLWPEGTRVRVIAARKGNYEYTTVLGANRRLAHYTDPDASDTRGFINREAFLAALQNGEHFQVTRRELRYCSTCQGLGYLRGDPQRGQSPDRRIPCPAAAPDDPTKTAVNIEYTIIWD